MTGPTTKKSTLRCKQCAGCGLIPAKVIVCSGCRGKKCIGCGESGFEQHPWIECNNCFGAGEITLLEADELKKIGKFTEWLNAKHLTRESAPY